MSGEEVKMSGEAQKNFMYTDVDPCFSNYFMLLMHGVVILYCRGESHVAKNKQIILTTSRETQNPRYLQENGRSWAGRFDLTLLKKKLKLLKH